MNDRMRIAALLLLILLALSGCTAGDTNQEEEPTAPPTLMPTPTMMAATLEPMITPKMFEGEIEEPTAGATPMLIYPVDLTIQFAFEEIVVPKLNIKLQLPLGWMDVAPEGEQNRARYQEPITTVQSGVYVQSIFDISVQQKTGTQTQKNAEDELSAQIEQLKDTFPGAQVTSMSNSRLLGEMGRYVSYRAEYHFDPNNPDATRSVRGRLHVTPVDRKLYVIMTMHPADFNNDYDEVYKKARETITES